MSNDKDLRVGKPVLEDFQRILMGLYKNRDQQLQESWLSGKI